MLKNFFYYLFRHTQVYVRMQEQLLAMEHEIAIKNNKVKSLEEDLKKDVLLMNFMKKKVRKIRKITDSTEVKSLCKEILKGDK